MTNGANLMEQRDYMSLFVILMPVTHSSMLLGILGVSDNIHAML